MGAIDLIIHLRQIGLSVGSQDDRLQISPAEILTDELKQTIRQSKAEILAVLKDEIIVSEDMGSISDETNQTTLLDRQQIARRLKALAILDAEPETQRGIYTDTRSDPDFVILAVAIRNVGTCELAIPRGKYDPMLFLRTLEQLALVTH
jgi:hypothetical protein